MKKNILFAAAVCAVALHATPARASSDSYLEVQVSTQRLAEIARARFVGATRSFCPFQVPCPSGGTCWLDHIEVGAPGTFSRSTSASQVAVNAFTSISSTRVFYDQPITMHVKTDTCVSASNCGTTTPYAVNARFAFEANGQGEICVQPVSTSPTIPGLPMPPVGFCFGLIDDQLSDFTGNPNSTVSGAALSMNPGATRVGVRLEVDKTAADYDAARIAGWNSFLVGGPIGGETHDWSMFVHKSIFDTALRRQVNDGIVAEPDVSLAGNITTSWTGRGSAGAVMAATIPAEVSAEALEFCPNSIGVDVGFSVDIQKNLDGNGIRSIGTLSMDANDGDAEVCALHYGPFGVMAATLIEVGVLDALLNEYLLPEVTKSLAECNPKDDHFTCDMQTHPRWESLGAGISVKLDLDDVVGSSDGLTLRGPMTSPPNHDYHADANVYDVRLTVGSGCYGSTCSLLGGVYVFGNANFCEVSYGPDPQNVYNVSAPSTQAFLPNEYEVTVNLGIPQSAKDAFDQNKYAQKIRVATSEGIRTYYVWFDGYEDTANSTDCTTQNLNRFTQCQKPIVFPFLTPPEIWEGIWRPGDDRLLVGILDPRVQTPFDVGLAVGVRLDVRRNVFGQVTSAAVVADVASGIGTTSYRNVPFSVPLNLPASARTMSDAQIAHRYLNQAYVRTPIATPYLPSGRPSADMQLLADPAQLLSAVLAGMQ